MKKKKLDTRLALTFMVAWLLSLLLILTVIAGVLVCTLCNRNFMKSQVLESGYHIDIYNELSENYTSYGNAGGIPPEVMSSIITADQVQQDIFASINALYNGDRERLLHPEVSNNALSVILANLESRGIQLTDEIRAGVQDLADGCRVDYETYTAIPFAYLLAPYMTRLSGLVWPLLTVLAFLSLAALLVLLQLQRSALQRLRWCIYAFAAGAVFCATVPLVAGQTIHMDRLNLDPLSLRVLLGSYVYGLFTAFFYFALLYAVAVIALFIGWAMHQKRQQRALHRLRYRRQEQELEQ